MSAEISYRHWKNGTGSGFRAVLEHVPDQPPTLEELEEKLEAIIDHIAGVKASFNIDDPGIKAYLRQKEIDAGKVRARIAKMKSLGACPAL